MRTLREFFAPVYGWFTEGFDTRDLSGAKALLEEFATPKVEMAPACSFRKRAPPSITTMLVSCFFGCWRILRNKGVGLGLPVSVSLFKQNAQRVPAHRPYLGSRCRNSYV